MSKTPSTHHTEPLEKTTFGKTYFVVDDAKHVWGADMPHVDAVRRREIVAGCGWSKTPRVVEMPSDPKRKAQIIRMVQGPDLGNTAPPAPAATDDAALLEELVASEGASNGGPKAIAAAQPSSNGSGRPTPSDDSDGDDDLSDLLDA